MQPDREPHTAFAAKSRVVHRNPLKSYGAGVLLHIHPPGLSTRPPTFGQVHFDGECESRRVWLADLSPEPVTRIIYTPLRCIDGAYADSVA